uniref:Allatostatin-1 n=2 Tax=Neoptera TaxID=33340 RepID=ALL1_RHOPR|nr:RecName: Full=Allatostatin-A4; Short=AST-A4; AltName: Full=LPVYNFGL-amide [Delia radicum]P85822.1 RecName: Full=Allatostatin-1; Short=Rhopr-AST-1 [Rhodnius prolixus]
LPVYNFGL